MNKTTFALSTAHRAIVAQSPLFSGDTGAILDDYLNTATPFLFYTKAGNKVILPPKYESCLGIVLEGHLRVAAENLAISVLTSGDLYGAATLYTTNKKPTTSITSVENSCLLLISEQDIDLLIAQHPLIRQNYLRYLTGRIQFLSGRLRALGAITAERKLARYLLSANDSVSCTATELARRIGVGRATLYRCLTPLEDADIISRTGRTITVLDFARLSDYT